MEEGIPGFGWSEPELSAVRCSGATTLACLRIVRSADGSTRWGLKSSGAAAVSVVMALDVRSRRAAGRLLGCWR